jgi:hypothetical protein
MRRRLVAGLVAGTFLGALAVIGACAAITGVNDLIEVPCVGASCATGGDSGSSLQDGDAGDTTTGPFDVGPDGACSTGLTACTGHCVELATNGENCGSCGHSCLGGSCASGACQAATLATVGGQPIAIAVSAANVYFAVYATAPGGYVGAVPQDGGSAQPLVTGQNTPRHLAVDAQHIYWVDTGAGGSVMMAALDGTNPVALASSVDDPWGLAVDGTAVYWAVEGSGDAGAIKTCPIMGCVQAATIASGLSRPAGVVTGGNDVYWTEAIDGGAIDTCAKSGCAGAPRTVAVAQNDPTSIAINGSNLVWVTDADGTVMTASLAAAIFSPTKLIGAEPSSGAFSTPVAADESNVYWTNQNDQTIRSCAISGCGGVAKILATGQASAGIAVDATAVYWTDYMRGTVMRLAK